MKITAVRATAVNIRYRGSALMSAGQNDCSTRTIVEIETDVGLTGLGEASYAHAATIIGRDFAPALLGLDPRLGTAALRRYCLPDHLDFGTPLLKVRQAAWGGVDIALWDLLAQAAGVPLYQLLGGAVRERAEFVAYAYSPPDAASAPAELAAIARAAVERSGAKIFEFKVGVHPVEIDIETVRAVHAGLAGTAQLAVDANMAWSEADARRFLREAAPLLENAEEPVASLRLMQQLASEFDVSVSAHCSDLDTVLAYPGVGVVPTLDAAGGITGVRALARALGAGGGRRLWLRSHAEAGIGWAAITHLGMSTPELNRPAQSLLDLIEEDLIVGERWEVRNGGVRAPATAGLGVVLDREALRTCHELYEQRGEVMAFPPALRRSCSQPGSQSGRQESFPIGAAVALEELARDPYPTYARMQDHEPVSWVPALRMYFVVRYEDVQAILQDSARYAVGTEHSTLFDTFGQHMLTVDGALHDRYRSAFQPHFMPGELRNHIESQIHNHVDRLLDGFAGRHSMEARTALASRLPILTMLSLLGLPLHLEEEMRRWYDTFEEALANFTWQADIRERAHRDVASFCRRIQQALDQYRRAPAAGALLSVLANAPSGSALADEALQRNALIILFGGISTVEALILNTLSALSVSPATLERVRANHSLIPVALEETMRWSGPVQSATRHVVAATTFEDVEFRAGDIVNCMIAAANRDPRKFADPHRFDIDRPGLRQHLGFAIGTHHCLGSHLAKLEARIALQRIFSRLPNARVDPAGSEPPYGHEFRRPRRLTLLWD